MTNMLGPVRLYQSGVEGVQATGTLHMATKPTANDTVTIGTVVYTFKASAVSPGDVAIGALVSNSQTNLVAAVNGLASPNTTPNPFGTLAAFAGNDAVFTARMAGPAGNGITTTASLVAGAPDQWGGATLSGGSHARGTAVAATQKLLTTGIDFDPTDTFMRPQLSIGLAVGNPGNEFAVQRGTKITVPDFPVNYEQLPIWLSMAIKGGVLPATAAASVSGPFTWTFTRSLTADPALAARTFERRLSDGSNYIDDEWAYAMCDQIAFKWQRRGSLMLSASLFSRRRQNSTLTPALTYATPEMIPSALTKVYIDSTWANRGVTQVSGQVLDGEIVIPTGLSFYESSDGRSDLDFTAYEFNARNFKPTAKLHILVQNSAQYATEQAAAEAGTLRAIQLCATGSSSRSFKLSMLAKHQKASAFKVDEIDGQDVIELAFEVSTDGTNVMEALLVNTVGYDN